jgi:hypothetical protein
MDIIVMHLVIKFSDVSDDGWIIEKQLFRWKSSNGMVKIVPTTEMEY